MYFWFEIERMEAGAGNFKGAIRTCTHLDIPANYRLVSDELGKKTM